MGHGTSRQAGAGDGSLSSVQAATSLTKMQTPTSLIAKVNSRSEHPTRLNTPLHVFARANRVKPVAIFKGFNSTSNSPQNPPWCLQQAISLRLRTHRPYLPQCHTTTPQSLLLRRSVAKYHFHVSRASSLYLLFLFSRPSLPPLHHRVQCLHQCIVCAGPPKAASRTLPHLRITHTLLRHPVCLLLLPHDSPGQIIAHPGPQYLVPHHFLSCFIASMPCMLYFLFFFFDRLPIISPFGRPIHPTFCISAFPSNIPRLQSHQLTKWLVARVQKIIAADPDRTHVSKNASFAIALATEMFIQHIATTTHNVVKAERKPRRNIQYRDVASAVAKTDNLEFLVDVVPKTMTYKEFKMRQEAAGKGKNAETNGNAGPSSAANVSNLLNANGNGNGNGNGNTAKSKEPAPAPATNGHVEEVKEPIKETALDRMEIDQAEAERSDSEGPDPAAMQIEMEMRGPRAIAASPPQAVPQPPPAVERRSSGFTAINGSK